MATVKQDKRPEKFRQMADGLQKTVEAKLNPGVARQRQTPRRAHMAEMMAREGRRLQKVQAALRSMADAVEAGNLPEVLAAVSTKADVEALLSTYPRPTPALVKRGMTEEQAKDAKLTLENMLPGEDPRSVRLQKLKEKERALVGVELPGFFPTPRAVADKLLDLADVRAEHVVLEPSAGKGDLLLALADRFKPAPLTTPGSQPHPEMVAVECSMQLSNLLCAVDGWMRYDYGFGFEVVAPADFTEYETNRRFDRVLMNPPFEKGQDMEHVKRAYGFLKPGGRLVSVMSVGPFFRSDRQAEAFRTWFDEVGGERHELEDKAFDGPSAFRCTGVKCVLVVLDKPEADDPSALVQMYTTAPADYDGFSTKTLNPRAGNDSGKTVRLVQCEKRDEEWQRSRYFSGLYSAYDEQNWKKLVSSGLAKEWLQKVEVRVHPALATPGKFLVASVLNGHLANDEHENMLFDSEAEAAAWAEKNGYYVLGGPTVTAGDLAVDGERHAPVSGCRCRSCGKNAKMRPATEQWTVRDSAAYCPDCKDEEQEQPAVEAHEEAHVEAHDAPATEAEPMPSAERVTEEKKKPEKKRRAKKDKTAPKQAKVRPVLLLPANLAALSKLAAKDHTRAALTGVRVESNEEGYRCAATDGKVLGFVCGEPDDADQFPETPALKEGSTKADAMLPAKAWNDAFKSVPKFCNPVLKNVAVVMHENSSTLVTTDLDQTNVLQPRHLDGKYPDYPSVLPKRSPKVSVKLDAKLFVRLLQVAAEFADESKNGVVVELYGKDEMVVVRTKHGGQTFTGAVMPLM